MQDDSADQIFEELQDIVQQAILREFPNPERKGCSGPEELRELANRPRPTRDAAWEHVTHCSPCYREFLDLRSQVSKERKVRQRVARTRLILAAVVLVLIVAGAYQVFQRGRLEIPAAPGSYQSASLDLQDRSAPRSAEGRSAKTLPLVLPAKRLELAILLPTASEPGRYEIQVLKRIDEPILNTSGQAQIEQATMTLRTKLDLTAQTPGSYLLGLRKQPSDWTYYPVIIR